MGPLIVHFIMYFFVYFMILALNVADVGLRRIQIYVSIDHDHILDIYFLSF